MLPADKPSLPKFLYLDQNKWIDLARAHYGRSDGAPFQDALAAVREAVKRNSVLVPVSAVHLIETMAPTDPGRRERIARFIVELSNNCSMLPHTVVRELEILHAVGRKYGQTPPTSIRPEVLQKGLYSALGAKLEIGGVPAEHMQSVNALVEDPETSIRMLVESMDRSIIQQERKDDEALVVELESTRRRAEKRFSDDERHRIELADLFTNGQPKDDLLKVLKSLGIPLQEFTSSFATTDQFVAFFHDIPTIDVFVTLGLARDKEMTRPIHRNDVKDMAFLCMAVPYANIIVAENYWSGVVIRTGLSTRYSTRVLTNAADLPEILHLEGCI